MKTKIALAFGILSALMFTSLTSHASGLFNYINCTGIGHEKSITLKDTTVVGFSLAETSTTRKLNLLWLDRNYSFVDRGYENRTLDINREGNLIKINFSGLHGTIDLLANANTLPLEVRRPDGTTFRAARVYRGFLKTSAGPSVQVRCETLFNHRVP